MTYLELIKNATWELNHNKITLEEYEEMIKPLNRDVDACNKMLAEIYAQYGKWDDTSSGTCFDIIIDIIHKYYRGTNK